MSLTVVTNERYFYPDALAPDERHLGTRDRFDVSKQYDYPGKAVGCLKAARMLQHRTLPGAPPTLLGPLLDGQGNAVAPICWVSSNRMPDLKEFECGHDAQYLRNLADPLGGLGNLPSSFYTMIRGLRIAFPNARHGGLLEGGYDELRWFTCLPPALMALYEQPQDSRNRCKAFGAYRRAFTPQF